MLGNAYQQLKSLVFDNIKYQYASLHTAGTRVPWAFYWVASIAIPVGKWVGFVRFITGLPVWQTQLESAFHFVVFFYFFPCR